MNQAASGAPAPQASLPSGPTRRDRALFAGLVLYVATLGVFTVNEIFRLDLFEWEIFTPELHTWVYELLHVLERDPNDPSLFRDTRSIEKTLGRLRDVLARTRYARVVTPGSLEDRLNHYLGSGVLEAPEVARASAKAFYEEGQAEARARLADDINAIEDWVTIPIFVKYLDHESLRMRHEVFALLKKVVEAFQNDPGHDQWRSENFFNYDPNAPRLSRQEAIRRWKAWIRTLDLP